MGPGSYHRYSQRLRRTFARSSHGKQHTAVFDLSAYPYGQARLLEALSAQNKKIINVRYCTGNDHAAPRRKIDSRFFTFSVFDIFWFTFVTCVTSSRRQADVIINHNVITSPRRPLAAPEEETRAPSSRRRPVAARGSGAATPDIHMRAACRGIEVSNDRQRLMGGARGGRAGETYFSYHCNPLGRLDSDQTNG